MKRAAFIAACCISTAVVASGHAQDRATHAETNYSTIDGELVRYDGDDVIVLRTADNEEVVFTFSPSAVPRTEVTAGRRAELFPEVGKDGELLLVSSVTTIHITPQGDVERTTEETRGQPSRAGTRTTIKSVSGKLEAYEPGQRLTITKGDGRRVTYVISERSKVPAGLVVGKTVAFAPVLATGFVEPDAQAVTITTTKTETLLR